ncbi:MAG: AAA family ATPase, partial [Desulfovibrionales bacterium]|nr:AAA family ATPase [Desulfovibrionales bacterium]
MNALKINKLAIIGRRKNYVIPFHSGLNIILGDSDTGKSSILELINYSLGSKKLALYKEIESTAIFVCLEFSVSGETYTLRRHILDPKLYIHIFACPFENIESTEPSYTVAPFFSLTPPADGYLSEFLFDKLAIPPIKIKQAPTKENSRTARLSFRDIFKYCYLDQDEVGSKYILDSNNPILATRNKEVFKFLFNFLDENISALQVRISEIKKEQAELKSKKLIISEFLKESGFKTLEELDKSLEVLDRELANAEDALTNISESMKSSVGNYEGVREQLLELEYVIQEMKVKLYKSDEKITQFVELKNEY